MKSLRPFLSSDLVPAENDQIPALVRFDTGAESFAKFSWGLPVEKFIDLCDARYANQRPAIRAFWNSGSTLSISTFSPLTRFRHPEPTKVSRIGLHLFWWIEVIFST